MSRRIKVSDLHGAIYRLNVLTSNPTESYSKAQTPNAGCYVLDSAYGGHCLQQMVKSGGARTVISGYTSKRELYEKLHAYISGVLSQVTV